MTWEHFLKIGLIVRMRVTRLEKFLDGSSTGIKLPDIKLGESTHIMMPLDLVL